MTEVIQIEQLVVTYRDVEARATRTAVDQLTFKVRPGEVFGFLGPNGAGKTSTMNVLLGFTHAAGGSASIFGVDVRQPIARRRIGYLPEMTYYYKFLTAEELLRAYGRIFGLSPAAIRRRTDELLALVELESARGRLIRTYSKGMQQRLGLAQALLNEPDLLILDEPTSGLDPLGRMKVREIILRQKAAGKTVFFSSHELGEVESVCDRVAILHRGQLRALGTVAEVSRGDAGNLEQAFLRIIGWESPAAPVTAQ
jgi:ABC-2 type transport system ATP-binding protein